MNLIGIGTDIIEIDRIEKAIFRHGLRFLDRIFTQKEQDYCNRFANPYPHYAARFAAKEAVFKALGTGLKKEWSWLDLEIFNDPNGKPEAFFSDNLKTFFSKSSILLTLSHCRSFATATAIHYKKITG